MENLSSQNNDSYIIFDAGCGIWEAEPFDSSIDWHNDEWRGTKEEAEKEAEKRTNGF
jgi:hypothetical protein